MHVTYIMYTIEYSLNVSGKLTIKMIDQEGSMRRPQFNTFRYPWGRFRNRESQFNCDGYILNFESMKIFSIRSGPTSVEPAA